MLRGFRHTLFLLLQVGVLLSGAIALAIEPAAWRAIAICLVGALTASLICERIAARYLRGTLGRLRRIADDIGRGRPTTSIESHPGDDFHKLVAAINLVALRLSEASKGERRLQDELRRRERMAFLGELAASVAHEVNNPLDGLQNCVRILRRSSDDPQRAAQMLDLIDDGLKRIELIVRRLLTLARENVIRAVEGRICDVIESAIAATANRIETRRVQVVRRFDAADASAWIDPQLLEQVFVNLILNAADSMPRGGELTISVRHEPSAGADNGAPAAESGQWLCVDFADTGSGIAPEALAHIFEPFFTTKADGKGTGLGLPIAARIVDAHRGTLTVAPRSGGGSVFTVRIPASLAAFPAPSDGAPLLAATAGTT